MAYVDAVNKAVNTIVADILGHPEFFPLLNQARKTSHRFCLWPIYTDLVAFWKLVEVQLLELPESDVIDAIVDYASSEDGESFFKTLKTQL